jgi:hypothetical protein
MGGSVGNGPVSRALLALAAAALASCAVWRPVEVTDSWTLYARPDAEVDAAGYHLAIAPAFEAVEARMGPFEHHVRMHAWDGGATDVTLPGDGQVQEVPGLGSARVRAYHVRPGANPFRADGVFLGTTEVGTIAHELVHARLAESSLAVPLWFEEGLASLWGDGVMFEGRWVVDGLACWPLRELREEELDDGELESILRLRASDAPDSRANLLVHFVGWAIVFDLAREAPEASWREWLAAFERGAQADGRIAHARRRLERALESDVEADWLARLASPDPGQRLATARGLWKLRSRAAVDRLLEQLAGEQHPEVRYACAINAFLAAPEMRVGRSRWMRIRDLALPVLREPGLSDEREAEAAETFYRTLYGRRRRNSGESLAVLNRYWEE